MRLLTLFIIVLLSIQTYCQQYNTWQPKTSMDIPRAFHSMAAYDCKIYIIGGSTGKKGEFRDTSSVAMFDLQTNSWTNKSPMPEAITTSAAVVIGNKIFIAGGQQNVFNTRINKVLMYDCIKDTWKFKSSMNIPRAFHSIVAVDNKLYAIGGREREEEIKSKSKDSLAVFTIEEYDIVSDKWSIKAIFPFKHFVVGAVAMNNKIYILSDSASHSNLGKSAILEEYDPVNNSFKTLAPLTPSRCDITMSLCSNKIYVIGGWRYGSISTVDEYDPALDKWTHRANLPYEVQNLQSVSVGESIFISGGIIYPDGGNEKKREILEYKK